MSRNGETRYLCRRVFLFVGLALGLGLQIPAHTPTSNQLYVYEHVNYEGAYIRFDGTRDEPDLRSYNTGPLGSPNWNDRISSFKIGSDLKVVFYEHINYKGASWTVKGPAEISSMVSNGWNDRVSSLRTLPK
ncbi:MAG: peptidase inhibitor family I36 protein [Candidatus Aminicenantales bacterium]